MKIEVTEDDINTGRPNNCHKCPITIAAHRAGLTGVTVTNYCINFDDPDLNRVSSLELPEKAQLFIEKYNNYEPVRPFSFEIGV